VRDRKKLRRSTCALGRPLCYHCSVLPRGRVSAKCFKSRPVRRSCGGTAVVLVAVIAVIVVATV